MNAIDVFLVISVFFSGAFLGVVIGVPPTGRSSEWETWFRYYLDAVGRTSIHHSAALADAAMDEIGKRRKG